MKYLMGITIFSLGFVALAAYADFDSKTIFSEQQTCVGMDAKGNTIRAIIDPTTNTVNVNGDIFKFTAGTVGKNGASTDDYTTDEGHLVYDSVTKSPEGKFTLYQFDSKTDKARATVPLACHTSSSSDSTNSTSSDSTSSDKK